MKEQAINRILTAAEPLIAAENLPKFRAALDSALRGYTITKAETALALPDALSPAVKAWLVTKKVEGRSAKTLELYASTVRRFFAACGKPMDAVTSSDLRLYLYQLQQSGCSARTAETYRTILCGLFAWAAGEGYLQRDPAKNVAAIKHQPRPRQPLTAVELELLRQAAAAPRDRALLEVLYSTGCRVSEIVTLKLSDIDFAARTAVVVGKGSKQRKVYFSQTCLLYLRFYLAGRPQGIAPLFASTRAPYKALTVSGVQRIFRRLGEAAGISRTVHPHLIRHTSATDCLSRGMDITEIQRMLGHSSVATTMVYAHLDDTAVQHSHDKCLA